MDGILLVDKVEGMTSHDVVGACRRQFSRRDIGHAGTLDPLATGLLVVLIGKATKLSDFLLNGDKAYQTRVKLGIETDTDDITGQITREVEGTKISRQEIEKQTDILSGALELKVPIYSAIKVKGRKLYEKARKGEDFVPPRRPMEFRNLQIVSSGEDWVEVAFDCSKGSYVRAWAKALGENLGCGATVETLRRTHSIPYQVEQALPFENLENSNLEDLQEKGCFIPLERSLPGWPLVKVEGFEEKLISNGQISRRLERFLELEFGEIQGLPGIKVVSKRSGRLVCILSHTAPLSFKIRRVFPIQ